MFQNSGIIEATMNVEAPVSAVLGFRKYRISMYHDSMVFRSDLVPLWEMRFALSDE
jgi:hypothetical protein